MVMDGGRDPEVFPDSFLKGPHGFPYILLIIIQFVTLLPIDYTIFLCDSVPVLGGHEVLDGVASW